MARRERTVIRSPLAPPLLKEVGAFESFPKTPEGFDPEGAWTNLYRIWTCHGYRQDGNFDVGHLRIERQPGDSAKSFRLIIEYKMVNSEGVVNLVNANVECNTDPIASLVGWSLSSKTFEADGKPVADLGLEEKIVTEDGKMKVEMGSETFERPGFDRFTGDWCVFEATQRLPFEKGAAVDFDMLEGLSLVKKEQRLSYRGSVSVDSEMGVSSLHQCVQIGRGVLPFEYWLDEKRRLLLATTFSRAYILDEGAVENTDALVAKSQDSYRQIVNRSKKEGAEL